MEEVSGPVIAIALILTAVFRAHGIHSRNHGAALPAVRRDYCHLGAHFGLQRLTLSPALRALAPPTQETRGLLGRFFDGFNRVYGRATYGLRRHVRRVDPQATISMVFLGPGGCAVGWFGKKLPSAFCLRRIRGTYSLGAASLRCLHERTDAVCRQVEEILGKTPGIKPLHYRSCGYSLLSGVRNTYSAFFWVTLKEWSERAKPEERFDAIKAHLAKELSRLPTAVAFPISPPAIQGVGTAGGFTFILQDRSGRDLQFLSGQLEQVFLGSRAQTPGTRRPQHHLPAGRAPGFRQCGIAIRPSSRAWTSVKSIGRSRPSWAARSLTTSIALAVNGRFMFRPKGIIAPAPKTSACSMCITMMATRFRFLRSPGSSRAPAGVHHAL